MLDFININFPTFLIILIIYTTYSVRLYYFNNAIGTIFCSLISLLIGVNLLPINDDSKFKLRTLLLILGTPLVIKTFYELRKNLEISEDSSHEQDIDT